MLVSLHFGARRWHFHPHLQPDGGPGSGRSPPWPILDEMAVEPPETFRSADVFATDGRFHASMPPANDSTSPHPDWVYGIWEAYLFEGRWRNGCVFALDPGGARLATGYDGGGIALWDVASGRLLAAAASHGEGIEWTSLPPRVSAIAVEGWRVVSGSARGEVVVYDFDPETRVPDGAW